jgi:hypothetical protein
MRMLLLFGLIASVSGCASKAGGDDLLDKRRAASWLCITLWESSIRQRNLSRSN